MKNKYLLLFFCLCVWSVQALRAVEVISLDRGWKFHRGYESVGEELTVDLPHTWNKGDVMFAGSDYYRGMCIYSRPLSVPASWAGRRVFLRVEAAQTVADVFVNRRFVTQHRGGYTAFVAELTDYLKPGQQNRLQIMVSNAQRMDVAPIDGDFNLPGGLYRGVQLLVTDDDVCIAPDYYASSGVFFTQSEVSEQRARLRMEALLSAKETSLDGCAAVE